MARHGVEHGRRKCGRHRQKGSKQAVALTNLSAISCPMHLIHTVNAIYLRCLLAALKSQKNNTAQHWLKSKPCRICAF